MGRRWSYKTDKADVYKKTTAAAAATAAAEAGVVITICT